MGDIFASGDANAPAKSLTEPDYFSTEDCGYAILLSKKMPSLNITIVPATHADVPALARIARDACREDRLTQLKARADPTYLSTRAFGDSLRDSLRNPRHAVVKATDAATGATLGSATFGFARFAPADVPRADPGVDIIGDDGDEGWEEEDEEEREDAPAVNGSAEAAAAATAARRARAAAAVRRLDAMQDADLRLAQAALLPDAAARCVAVVSLSVSPAHRSRGVGSQLLRWGVRRADEARVFAWARSSEAAWRVYARAGFVVVKELGMELDEWAAEGREGGEAWGRYVVRYMRRPAVGETDEAEAEAEN
jgi:GNAT superfamily N-acetyltransferase